MDICQGNNCLSVGASLPGCVGCDVDPRLNPLCFANTVSALGITYTSSVDGIITITVPNGLTISPDRLNGSISRFNSQLPTGSFEGYVSSLLNNTTSSLSNNLKYIFGVIIASIILAILLLYIILCITLMCCNVVEVTTGIVLIFFGLIIIALAFMITIIEAKKVGTDLTSMLDSEMRPILTNIRCAINSAICCYVGYSCCCPNGSQTACTNPPPNGPNGP